MTTVVNNPTPGESGGNSALIVTIIIIGFLFVVLYFGIPAIKNMGPVQVNVPAPQVNVPAPQINVPAPQITVPAPQINVPAPQNTEPTPKIDVSASTPVEVPAK